MIDIEDYNFEEGSTFCDECTMHQDCVDYTDDMAKFNQDVRDKFGDHELPACMRFKITKKIKNENSNN